MIYQYCPICDMFFSHFLYHTRANQTEQTEKNQGILSKSDRFRMSRGNERLCYDDIYTNKLVKYILSYRTNERVKKQKIIFAITRLKIIK